MTQEDASVLNRPQELEAADPDAPEEPTTTIASVGLPFVVFALDASLWAFPALAVVHMTVPQRPLRVPTAPDRLLGLVRVRQRIIALVDLRSLLELPPRAAERNPGANRLLVVHTEATDFAVEVDRVLGLQEIARDSIRAIDDKRADRARKPAMGQLDLVDGTAVILDASVLIDPLLERASVPKRDP